MSNGFLAVPLAYTVTATAADSAFPAANLANEQPKIVFQTTQFSVGSPPGTQIDIDLGADTEIDTVAVLHTNLSASATWQVSTATAAAPTTFTSRFFGAFGVTPLAGRRHGLWVAAAGSPVTCRYVRIQLSELSGSNPERLIRVGNVVVADRLEPAFNFELGSGRRFDDQSQIRTLPGGETYVERGGVVPIWQAVWSNLSDAELRSIDAQILRRGKGRPILAVEDPDAVTGQAEAIHWGLNIATAVYERTWPDKNRVDVSIQELL